MKREINSRRLLNSDNVFTPIECLCLKKVNATECSLECDEPVRRSEEKLPKLQEGIYNYTIQGVYNLDNSEEIFPTTIREYINMSKLRYKPNKKFYMIKNGYLYILDRYIENVNIYLYSNELIYDRKSCDSAYDHEFKFPEYLLDSLFQLVNKELSDTYKRSTKDITDNNLEEKQ